MQINMSALREAVLQMDKTPETPKRFLPAKLKEIARSGKKTKFQFNHLGIRYQPLLKDGILYLRWTVSNGMTGEQKTYYTKDFMSKNGKVLWRALAGKINAT